MGIIELYLIHMMLAVLLITILANIIIIYYVRKIDNLLLLSALLLYGFVNVTNMFFGPKTEIGPYGNILSQSPGVLNIAQTHWLILLAHVLLALAFIIKAYKVAKKT